MKQFPLLFLFAISFTISVGGQTPGATFCGPYNSSSPISLTGVSDRTFSELEISNPNGDAIELINCHNIIIERCYLRNSLGNGVALVNCTNVQIIDSRFESVASGVYALTSSGVSVTYCDSKNVMGPFPRGQMVQFNQCFGGGNRINYNVSENITGQSNPEDAINTYQSTGLANDPIQIYGNWIRGGGPSDSGSGIMLGDNGSSYAIAKDNILVNPGQVGIAIAGGTNNQLIDNTVYSISNPWTNVGLFVWNWSGNPPGTVCANHTVSGNQVNWTNSDGTANHRWDADNCGNIVGWDTNTWGASIDETILPMEILSDCSNSGSQPMAETVPVKAEVVVELGDISVDNADYGIILKSPSGECYRVTVADGGELNTELVECP